MCEVNELLGPPQGSKPPVAGSSMRFSAGGEQIGGVCLAPAKDMWLLASIQLVLMASGPKGGDPYKTQRNVREPEPTLRRSTTPPFSAFTYPPHLFGIPVRAGKSRSHPWRSASSRKMALDTPPGPPKPNPREPSLFSGKVPLPLTSDFCLLPASLL